MYKIRIRIPVVIREIKNLQLEIDGFEPNPDDYITEYDEMLDEVYGDFMGSYSAGYTLKCVDETAYSQGLLNYVDNLGLNYPSEWDSEMEDLKDELNDLIDDIIGEYQSELDLLAEEDEDYGKNFDEYTDEIDSYENLRKEWC